MAMPAAQGLFHRAATMSGQQLTASGPLNATTRARAFLDALSLPLARVDEIRTLPLEKLIAAHEAIDPIIGRGSLYFGPVLDNRTLQRHPFYPDAPPQSASIPMIIGNTHDETRTLIGNGDPSTFNLTWQQLPARRSAQWRAPPVRHSAVHSAGYVTLSGPALRRESRTCPPAEYAPSRPLRSSVPRDPRARGDARSACRRPARSS
jgi:carboxylesterase type B